MYVIDTGQIIDWDFALTNRMWQNLHQVNFWASQVALVVKNPSANVDIRVVGSIPGLGRSPAEGHGNPLQYFCLENPVDRGAWWATSMGLQRVRHN